MKAGAPLENKNAEKWTEEEAEFIMFEAMKLSQTNQFDFVGEIAKKLGTYREAFTYLVNKFPSLKSTHNVILSNLEANCFSHGKSGDINTAMAIVNLKSNYGWTDRQQTDHTTNGKEINLTPIEFVSTKDK